jgi:hypothetical protein
VWSHLLEGVGFYTTGSAESVHETFMDMNNPARDEPVHKNDMAKFLRIPTKGPLPKGILVLFLSLEMLVPP